MTDLIVWRLEMMQWRLSLLGEYEQLELASAVNTNNVRTTTEMRDAAILKQSLLHSLHIVCLQ